MTGFPIDYGYELSDQEALHNVKMVEKIVLRNPWLWSFIPFIWSQLSFASNAFPDAPVTPGQASGGPPPSQQVTPAPTPIINVKPMAGVIARAACITLLGAALPYGIAVAVGAICGGVIVAVSKP